MPEVTAQATAATPDAPPLRKRVLVLNWTRRVWRPVGTAIAVILALLVTWHVIYGKHGLSTWLQMRNQDRELRKQIQDLQQENSQLRDRIQHLKSDPDAIEHEAREKLHYARPGEVIYSLPAAPQSPQNAPGK